MLELQIQRITIEAIILGMQCIRLKWKTEKVRADLFNSSIKIVQTVSAQFEKYEEVYHE